MPSLPRRPDRDQRSGDAILLIGSDHAMTTLSAAGYLPVLVDADQLDTRLTDAPWDLVIIGWSDEQSDGAELCGRIRAHPRHLDVPVIIEVSSRHDDRPAAALAAGADDYVTAPWEPVELLTRVRLALTVRRATGVESRWHALIANLPGTVYRCDFVQDWTMHYMSDQVTTLTGYRPEEFIGSSRRTFASIIHPEDRRAVELEVAAAVAVGDPFVSTFRIIRADGEVRHVIDRGRLVEGHHGRRWLDGFIVDVTARTDTEQRLRATLAEQATSEERARIARDLHDSVSQSLFSMTLHARAAQLSLLSDGPDDGPAQRSIIELRQLAQTALAEMRALIVELRPDALADEGLVAALRTHAAAIAAREALSVSVDAPDDLTVAADVEEALYRLTQEALHNTVKHARSSRVTVSITATDDDRLVLEVRDDGIGFDPDVEHPGHFGLATMRERITRVGGTLQIRSSGTGTCLRADAPLRRA